MAKEIKGKDFLSEIREIVKSYEEKNTTSEQDYINDVKSSIKYVARDGKHSYTRMNWDSSIPPMLKATFEKLGFTVVVKERNVHNNPNGSKYYKTIISW